MENWTAETLYDKLKSIKVDNPMCQYTLERCKTLIPFVRDIQKLKKEQDALILAHSYIHPDIIYTVADHVGDSYYLAKKAMEAKNATIIFPAVRFMAETAKILNPSKTVLDPNPNGGCSLADSIDAETVLALRKEYPEHTFICYVNTTAAVKAACDICVTSSNVFDIVKNVPSDKIYFLPDKLMGENILSWMKEEGIDKELLFYDGTCYVHEEYAPEQVSFLKQTHPKLKVLAHPECSPGVTEQADIVGSTSKMYNYIREKGNSEESYLLLTECGLSSRLQVEMPEINFVGSCMLCRYMKSNHLEQILRVLQNPKESDIIHLDPEIQDKALKCLEAMFTYSKPQKVSSCNTEHLITH